jgi:hypothetical protein
MGFDMTYDDNEGWMQKLSPKIYPYKYEIIDDREYLMLAHDMDGSAYITKKGTHRGAKFERRPCWVVQMTQLDPNYVYSKRVFWVDKEMLLWINHETYDRKGRLYRTFHHTYGWDPEMGVFSRNGAAMICMSDWVDNHVTWDQDCTLPAQWRREDISMEGIVKK